MLARDWAETFHSYHPGVTTMWLSGIGLRLFARQRGLSSDQLLGVAPTQPGTMGAAVAAGVVPMALVIALCIAISYPLLRRITGRRVAIIGSCLLAMDPFYIAYSKVLHVDALLERDVITMAIPGAIALIIVFLLWKEFKLLCFDSDFGASLGFPMGFLDILLTTVLVVAIVLGLQTVGVVLMSAMVVAPAAAARQWTDKMGLMIVLSALFGALAGISGAVICSTTSRLPIGPTNAHRTNSLSPNGYWRHRECAVCFAGLAWHPY